MPRISNRFKKQFPTNADVVNDLDNLIAKRTKQERLEADVSASAAYLTDAEHTALAGDHVTNGDSHNHLGGGGGEIAHSSLGGVTSDQHHAQAHKAEHITGGSDVIANAVAAGASGLMSGADKTKLDGITAGAVADHGNLTGLSDDDHSIYAKLAGRSSSQTIEGAVDASGSLVLTSTHHATKGTVYIGGDGSTNSVSIGSDGNLVLNGTATAWEDLRIEPVAKGTGANNPAFEKWLDDAAGTSIGVFLYSFTDVNAGQEKEIYFTMQMPHAWALGTDISFHVHWMGNKADTTATPRWGLEYAWKDIGETFGDTTIVYAVGATTPSGTDTDIVAYKHYLTEFTDITPGTTADGLSSIFVGRLFRDSANEADTYNVADNKVGLLYIDAHYLISTFGSNAEYTK